MPRGTLEVILISAKGLEDSDFFSKMDPYVVATYRSQEKKTSAASGQGSEPEWNECLMFTVSAEASDLFLKLMDEDAGTQDDFIGEVRVPLEAVFEEGSLPPTSYNVVKDDHFCGEIKIALNFNSEECRDRDRDYGYEQESFGGWKQSARDY